MNSNETCTPDKCYGNQTKCNGICLGSQQGLYNTDLWRKSDEIEVSHFKQILLWPLALHRDSLSKLGKNSIAELTDQIIKTLGEDKHWEAVGNLRNHIAPAGLENTPDNNGFEDTLSGRNYSEKEQADIYSEYVYFHDFVQSNLFDANSKNPEKSVYLFRRRGNFKLKTNLQKYKEKKEFCLLIDRLNLYVFSTGAVILVMEISTPKKSLKLKPTPILRQITSTVFRRPI